MIPMHEIVAVSNAPLREVDAASGCPMSEFVQLVSGKWAIPILYRLIMENAPVRFGVLQRAVLPITQKELTRQLRLFETRHWSVEPSTLKCHRESTTKSPSWDAPWRPRSIRSRTGCACTATH